MAVTRNTYTGNGSTVLYSFTFPYLEATDIKVSVNGTTTTAYTLANATTIQFNTAPANGASIAIYRQTDDTALAAAFYPGSAIRSADLNDNFTQNLYVTQESNRDATDAIGYGQQAISTANGAVSTANAATATANTASSNASAAVATANTASSNASAAVSTANTASSNATSAVNTANAATATANSAAANAATAISTANSAVSTANSAVSTANSAVTTAGNAVTSANSAVSSATAAVSTANTASTNASNAVTTANTASSNASTALSTANSALSTANAAASAVANAILYDTVANVAAIPASPTNNDAVEVVDSTGIESFTPLSGKPAGFVGDSGLSVRIVYTTTGSTWNWIQYFPNDPENRYGDAITTLQTDLNTAEADILALDSAKLDSTTAASTYQTQAGMSSYLTTSSAGSTYAPLASPTFTGTPTGPCFTVTGSSVPTNGVYLPASNSVAISTNSTGRLFIDSSGRLGIGTSSPAGKVMILGADTTSFGTITNGALNLGTVNGTTNGRFVNLNFGYDGGATNAPAAIGFTYTAQTGNGAGALYFGTRSVTTDTAPTERMVITAAGNVGIGTTSPNQALEVVGSQWLRGAYSTNTALAFVGNSGVGRDFAITRSAASTMSLEMSGRNAFNIVGNTGNTNCYFTFSGQSSLEHMRLDENGRLLVGTSSAVGGYSLQIEQNAGSAPFDGSIFLRRGISNASIFADYNIGTIAGGSNTNVGGLIQFVSDAAWGTNDYPTRLVFSTTSDNSASPSERLRIASTGALGLSGANYGSAGQVLTSQGSGAAPQWATPSSSPLTYISRVDASNATSVSFTSGIDSTYKIYVIQISELYRSGSGEFWLELSTNNGSTWSTTQYYTSNSLAANPSATSRWKTDGYTSNFATDARGACTVYLSNLNTATHSSFYCIGNMGPYSSSSHGYKLDTNQYNALRFVGETGGTLAFSGRFTLYGLST